MMRPYPSSQAVLAVALLGASLGACKASPEQRQAVGSSVTDAGSPAAVVQPIDAFLATIDSYCKGRTITRCGDLLYIDCGAAHDAVAFYVSESDGRRISTCGGACMGAGKDCETLCPPPAWTCGGTPDFRRSRDARVVPQPRTNASADTSCTPPYTKDSQGLKHFKPECL